MRSLLPPPLPLPWHTLPARSLSPSPSPSPSWKKRIEVVRGFCRRKSHFSGLCRRGHHHQQWRKTQLGFSSQALLVAEMYRSKKFNQPNNQEDEDDD